MMLFIFFRLMKWMRYTVVTLLLLNALQSFFLKTKSDDYSLLKRNKNYISQREKVLNKDFSIEKVQFYSKKDDRCEDQILRTGLLTKRKNAKGTLLICHGYDCNKYDLAFARTLFPEFNSLIFDFRAHGEISDNQLCTFGKDEAYDVMGAVNFIRSHPDLKNTKLLGYGLSMGAVSLIEAQSKKKLFDGLILDGPFDSSETIVQNSLNSLSFSFFGYALEMPGKGLIKEYIYNPYIQPVIKGAMKIFAGIDTWQVNNRLEKLFPVESVKKISVPCFFIHCKNDEKVPAQSVRNIFQNARCGKKLWLTNGRGHCDSFFSNPEKYIEKANEFLYKVVSGSWTENFQEVEEDS